jgi:hypothetical protein
LGYKLLPEWLKIDKQYSLEEIEIYPNPVFDFLFVKSKYPYMITVSDLNGREVSKSQCNSIVDFSNLSSGTYVLNLYDDNRNLVLSKKISKIN